MDKQPKIKSLYKAIKLLDHFTRTTPELGVIELAKLTGLQKSSVHNILQTFELCGMVQKNPKSNKYSLGKKTLELANKFQSNHTFQQTLKQLMKQLSNETGENVYYAVPYETQIIYLDAFSMRDPFLSQSIVGTVAPLYCTGVGKALLSEYPDSFLDEITFEKKFTENTICDKESLLREIDNIRKNGYAVDNMEHELGIKCVAVALKKDDSILGSISISGPSPRFSDESVALYAKKLIALRSELLGN